MGIRSLKDREARKVNSIIMVQAACRRFLVIRNMDNLLYTSWVGGGCVALHTAVIHSGVDSFKRTGSLRTYFSCTVSVLHW